MNQAAQQPQRRPMNATEDWAIYDTEQIRGNIKGDSNKGFRSFAEWSAKAKHPFFNVRNLGEVGLAYTNLETKDNIPYVFHVDSIGISFKAPLGIVPEVTQPEPPNEINNHHSIECASFVSDVPDHVGMIFKVQQDQKLLHTAFLAPAGEGVYGLAGGAGFSHAHNTASVTNATQGIPDQRNRWRFPDPIQIPRGATMSVELELSEYLQDLMKYWRGPWDYTFVEGDGPEAQARIVPACATVRVSMIGRREIQQVNELHR